MYSNLLLFLNKIKHCKEYVYQHAELFRFSQSVQVYFQFLPTNQITARILPLYSKSEVEFIGKIRSQD